MSHPLFSGRRFLPGFGVAALGASMVLAPIPLLARPSAIELEIVRGAELSLADAVLLAEKEVGGRVIEAELDEDDDMYFYRLDVMTDAGLTVLYLNPASGVVVGRRDPGLISGVMGGDSRARADGAAAGALVKALESAESRTGGHAVEGEIDRDDGRYLFEIRTIAPGIEYELEIDAVSGEILDIEEDD